MIEEQKVASLVAGSKTHEKMLNAIFTAIREWDGLLEDGVEPTKNEGLKKRRSRAGEIRRDPPETYIKRVLDYARQGYTSIEFSRHMTPIGTARPIRASPARTPTTRSG